MKHLYWIVPLVFLAALAAYLLYKGPAPRPYEPSPTPDLPAATSTPTADRIEASDAPGYAIFTKGDGSFSFAFPTNFDVASTSRDLAPGWSAPVSTAGMVLAKLVIPKEFEPGTNFSDATFTVGKSADPAAVASCLKTLAGAQATTTTYLGEDKFTKLEFTGAGAGNIYETTSYRILRGDSCWAVEYTIHSTNIGNYPPGTVDEYDEAMVTRALEEVARSFRFLE
jgi:hypothetical protein